MRYVTIIALLFLTSCSQSYFSAKIGERTVFDYDNVIEICDSQECMGLDYTFGDEIKGCIKENETYVCRYKFSIMIDEYAANRIAEETMYAVKEDGGYINKNLTFYYGDDVIDSLKISSDISGVKVNELYIYVEGESEKLDLALKNGREKMMEIIEAIKK